MEAKNEESHPLEERRSTERSSGEENKHQNRTNETNRTDDDNRSALDLVSTVREKCDETTEHSWRSSFETETNRKYKSKRYEDDSRSSRSQSNSPYRNRYDASDRGRRSRSHDRSGRRSRSRSQCRSQRYKTPDRSRLNRNRRSRSRSRYTSRRRETPDRSWRTHSRNVRRSRSRSRHPRVDTPDRCQSSRTRDRSRSRSRHRRDDAYRSRRSYSRDRGERSRADRSRYSSGDHRFDGKEKFSSAQNHDDDANGFGEMRDTNGTGTERHEPKNYANNSTIDILRSRIQSTLQNSADGWKNYSVSTTRQSGNVCNSSGEISSGKSNSVQSQLSTFIQTILSEKKDDAMTSSTVTSDELGRRIGSNLLKGNGTQMLMRYDAAHKATENNSESSIKSSNAVSIDDSIINQIVSRETSSATTHSNFNIDMPTNMNDRMQLSRINDPRLRKSENQRLQAQQAADMNGQVQLSRINDPRIQKIQRQRLQAQRDASQSQPQCSLSPLYAPGDSSSLSAIVPRQGLPHHAHVNFLAPSVLSDPRLAHTFQEPAAPGPFRPTKRFISNDQHSFELQQSQSSRNVRNVYPEINRAPRTYGQYKRLKSGTVDKATVVKPAPSSKVISNPTGWEFKIPKKEKTELATETTVHEQSSMRESKDRARTTENGRTKQSTDSTDENTMKTLKELMNPQHLLTLVGLMEQMTENNSLAKVKEILKKGPTEANSFVATDQDVAESLSTSADSELAEAPNRMKKKVKTELDKLHEDINNMFIRDGVLNANGRRRKRSQSNANASGESTLNDSVVDVKRGTSFLTNLQIHQFYSMLLLL